MSYFERKCVAFGKLPSAQIIDSTSRNRVIFQSTAVFERPVVITHRGLSKKSHVCALVITFDENLLEADHPKQDGVKLTSAIQNSEEDENGQVVDFDFELTLHVAAPGSRKSMYVDAVRSGLQVIVTGYLEAGSTREFTLDSDFDFKERVLEDAFLDWQMGPVDPPSWYGQAAQQAAWASFSGASLLRGSQVETIYQEFSQAYAEENLFKLPNPDEVNSIIELITDIRSALREYEKGPSEELNLYGSIWYSRPNHFREVLEKIPPDEAKVLREKHDTLWRSFDVMQVLQLGEEKFGARSASFDPKPDEIEAAVVKLTGMRPDVYSETLETLLLNALIYAEVIGFARYAYSKETRMGQKVWSIIKGTANDEPEGWWRSVGKLMVDFVKESAKVALTFGAAYVITGQETTPSWIVTAGFTLYRWLLRDWAHFKGTGHQKQIELTIAMARLHELVSKTKFSPEMARQELIRVSQLGAVFSPAVITLLERRLARERKQR